MAFGLTLPFVQSTGSSDYFEVTRTLVSAVEQNARSLLVTNWGERPMEYSFGCNLREFLFEQLDTALAPVIAERIRQQFARWMPFVRIENLNILFEGDHPSIKPNQIAIKMALVIVSDPSKTVNIFQVFGQP